MRNKTDDAWQILRIQGEFTKGFDTFGDIDISLCFGIWKCKN